MLNFSLIDNDKKETVVLFHGIGGNNNCFKYQLDTLSDIFNVLMIDLHGHGISNKKKLSNYKEQTFDIIVEDIINVLDKLNLNKVHLIGLSLGTMICNAILDKYPNRILSIVNIGAILKFDKITKYGLKLCDKVKSIMPYMMIYSCAGFLIMPSPFHLKARAIFVQEAVKLGRKEFFAWFNLLRRFPEIYDYDRLSKKKDIPIVYISGKYDKRFIEGIKEYVDDYGTAEYIELQKSGHICNIDNIRDFNMELELFYRTLNKKNLKNCINK